MKTFYSHRDEPGPGGCVNLFEKNYGLTRLDGPTDADIIIWNGGEDIGTDIYGAKSVSYGPTVRSFRDREEIRMFDEFAEQPRKLLLGICRGSQLLNCLNGGQLYQDVDGHGRTHPMIDLRTEEVINVTSTHHQQMIPNSKEGVVIGVSDCSRHKTSYTEGVENFLPAGYLKHGRDVEIMWYPRTHSLCIQGHPEYVPGSRFADYTLELLTQCWDEITATAKATA